MFGLRKTLGSIIMVVLFLALASLAAFLYSSDQEKQGETANSDLAQKSRMALGALVGAPESTIIDHIRKIDWESLIQGTGSEKESSSSELEFNSETSSDAYLEPNPEFDSGNDNRGFWSKLVDLVKKEWFENQKEDNF